MAHQYVVLPSNSSLEYYHSNTLANYKVKLAKPLELEGKYEVALVEIIYPHRKLSVEPDEAYMYVVTRKKVTSTAVKPTVTTPTAKSPKKRKKRDISDGEQQPGTIGRIKTNDIREEVQRRKDERKKLNERRRQEGGSLEETPGSSFSSNYNTYTLPSGSYDTILYLAQQLNALTPSVRFSIIEGTNKFLVELGEYVERVEFSGRMGHLLGFSKEYGKHTLTFDQDAPYYPHLEGNAHSLYIYSSIVDHQIVGDTVAPLLRVVCPDAAKLGQTVSEKYIKPYYLPVNSNYIDTIDIQIRTTTGHFFPFLSGNPVVASLHFRKC